MKHSFLILITLFFFDSPLLYSQGGIIDLCTENINEARGQEYVKSKGGPDNNKLTNIDSPVRAGKRAFKHWVNNKGERAELAMKRTEIGGIYWYGWSMLLPEHFDYKGSNTIVMQLATWPTPRNGRFPCNANGPFMQVNKNGKLIFYLQHNGDDRDMVCDKFILMDDVSDIKGKWLDFVMHAKWTGDSDGFLSFWFKVGDKKYQKKVTYSGRTWWNDEDTGPYFKMGLYTGEPGWKGPKERYLYTDEYRLGNQLASFEDVAPPAR